MLMIRVPGSRCSWRMDQDIGGLQIAMRDSLAMRSVESLENLPGVFDGFLDRQRTLERRLLDELHHQIVWTDIVKLADMCVIQAATARASRSKRCETARGP